MLVVMKNLVASWINEAQGEKKREEKKTPLKSQKKNEIIVIIRGVQCQFKRWNISECDIDT